MKTLLRTALLAVLALNLTACFQLKHPICTASQLRDLPGLEGEYEMRIFDSGKHETLRSRISLRHVSTGVYEGASQGTLEVCVVGGRYLAQSRTKQGNYEVTWLRPHADGFTVTALAADVAMLKRIGVPYQIILARPSSWLRAAQDFAANALGSQEEILLVDNASIAADQLVPELDTMSLDVTLWKVK
jgi:hypothetical protein